MSTGGHGVTTRVDVVAPAGTDDDTDPPGSSGSARQGIQSVEIAMTVLDALERGGGPMSLTQIAHASGMGASKAHRYLVSLGRAGMVAQSRSSGLYDMGPALRRLGAESLRRMDEVGLVSQYIPGLRDRTGHAVNLAVWGDHGPVIVRWDYGAYALPITVRVGATMPLLTSSVGRVYLAHLPRTLTEPVLRAQGAEPAPAEIDRITEEVRHRGCALTSGGVIPGIASVAAPVLTTGDSLPLVVALALPERAASPEVLEDVTAALLESTAAMSAELGVA
ncbi:IclR family transcriptional regulator [Actinomycetospora straminea]|uniref:IclR family transcriptional regulator n=1 Tax=Actinomycetospora straminea TaxID=663607 RepID=A0ABP9E2R9_9PSEU